MCGGTLSNPTDNAKNLGLSPRVRGNRGAGAGLVAGDGSIPACAGEPYHQRLVNPQSRVYPRVCGGTFTCGGCVYCWLGLSPRVRGNRRGD